MAFIVRIKNGTTTYNFVNDTTYLLEDAGVILEEPEEKVEWSKSPEGDVPVDIYYKYRKVKVRFSVAATTRAQIMDAVAKINDLLRKSLDYYLYSKAISRTEFQYAWDSTYISFMEVMYGYVVQPKDAMSVKQILQEPNSDGLYVVRNFEMVLYCKPRISTIGLGSTVGYHSITNCFDTGTSIRVRNTWEGTGICPYVKIPAAQLRGDMPLPTKIRLVHNGSYVGNPGKIFIGKSLKPYYTQDSDVVVELEDSEANVTWNGTVTHSGQTNTNYSNGEAELVTLPVSSTLMCYTTTPQIGEGIYRVFLLAGDRAFPEESEYRIEFRQRDGTGNVMNRIYGDYVVPINYHARTSIGWMVDLGMFVLPPNLQGLYDLEGQLINKYSMHLYAGSTSGSTQQASFDRLFFMPIDGGFRVLDLQVGLNTYNPDTIIDDGVRGYTYIGDSGTAPMLVADAIEAFFTPIMLTPQVDNYLWFLFENFAASDRNVYAEMALDVSVGTTPSYRQTIPQVF